MVTEIQYQTGPQVLADGTTANARGGKSGEAIVQLLHGRYYEQTYRGTVFSIGCTLTPLSAATILLTSSGQPIVGVWNPTTSAVNLVLLQASLTAAINTVTSVAPGGYIWAASNNNTSLTAGLAPFNRKTFASVGSQARAFSLSTASLLTGLTNNLAFVESADFATACSMLTTTVTAATMTPGTVGEHAFEGSLIVPPGGVVGLFNTVSSVTHSVAARLVWEEVPV